jgi:hypothetical protein
MVPARLLAAAPVAGGRKGAWREEEEEEEEEDVANAMPCIYIYIYIQAKLHINPLPPKKRHPHTWRTGIIVWPPLEKAGGGYLPRAKLTPPMAFMTTAPIVPAIIPSSGRQSVSIRIKNVPCKKIPKPCTPRS